MAELVSIPLTDTELAGSWLQLVARSGRSLPIAALTFAEALKEALFGLTRSLSEEADVDAAALILWLQSDRYGK